MSTLGNKLKHELWEFVPVAIFFFVAFQLIAFTQALMLEQYGIRISTFLAATIGALIVEGRADRGPATVYQSLSG
jgi:hypothetical protein